MHWRTSGLIYTSSKLSILGLSNLSYVKNWKKKIEWYLGTYLNDRGRGFCGIYGIYSSLQQRLITLIAIPFPWYMDRVNSVKIAQNVNSLQIVHQVNSTKLKIRLANWMHRQAVRQRLSGMITLMVSGIPHQHYIGKCHKHKTEIK